MESPAIRSRTVWLGWGASIQYLPGRLKADLFMMEATAGMGNHWISDFEIFYF
jgi:hypothetical protein